MNSNKDAATSAVPTAMMANHDNDMSTTSTDDDDDEEAPLQRFNPNLVRKLLTFRPAQHSSSIQQNHQFQSTMMMQQQPPHPRISNEAVLAAGELLRLFVLETRHRASIDAECEQEGGDNFTTTNNNNIINNMTSQSSTSNSSSNNKKKKEDGTVVQIRSDHITMVAAEMLMDFA
jgi:CENP-S associating Centromere protein X